MISEWFDQMNNMQIVPSYRDSNRKKLSGALTQMHLAKVP